MNEKYLTIEAACNSCRQLSIILFGRVSADNEIKISVNYWRKEICPGCFASDWSIIIKPAKERASVVKSLSRLPQGPPKGQDESSAPG